MFDNLRPFDEPEEESHVPEKPLVQKKKKVVRFRFPIFIDGSYFVEKALERFLEQERQFDIELPSPTVPSDVFLTHAFVRDADGREYRGVVPQFFEKYNLKKPKQNQSR